MTVYYLQVLVPDLSIELDSDINYHHHYHVGDVIKIHMYSDKGPKVVFGDRVEYDAEFVYKWDSSKAKGYQPTHGLIASFIISGYLSDITKMIHRQDKLAQLGL